MKIRDLLRDAVLWTTICLFLTLCGLWLALIQFVVFK